VVVWGVGKIGGHIDSFHHKALECGEFIGHTDPMLSSGNESATGILALSEVGGCLDPGSKNGTSYRGDGQSWEAVGGFDRGQVSVPIC
jgi:hypothetical protein